MKRFLLSVSIAALGCSQRDLAPSPDAAVSDSPLSVIASAPTFANVVARAKPFVAEGGSFRVSTRALAARVDAEATLHLETEGARLDVVSGGGGAAIEAHAVIARAGEDTSIVFVATDDGVEELRTLASSRASTHFTWRLRPGAGIAALRLVDGRVEALDAQGAVRIVSAPMFAVDANGKYVPLRVSLDGDVLRADLDSKGLAFPIIVDPAWTAGGLVVTRRTYANGVRLDDGRVLAIGGGTTASELYDPATGAWTAGPAMTGSAYGFDGAFGGGAGSGLVKLVSGKVLATFSTASLYNPATNTWSAAGTLPGVSTFAAPLPGGKRVLAACHNVAGSATNAAYLYDETTNAWTSAASMGSARAGCSGVALADGRVLVLGGDNSGGSLSSGEIYNATTNAWTAIAPMNAARRRASVVRLADGRVLAGRGTSWQVYNPTTNAWTATPATTASHDEGTLTLLASGRVLLAGGDNQSAAEIYNPSTNTWTTGGAMSTQRGYHLAVRLANDRVLIAMGARNYSGPSGWTTINASELYGDSLGQTCTAAWECASGNCVEGVCCATATCPSGASCATTSKRGTCVYPLGVACTGAAQCESGYCVDGYCCNAACTGQCEACDLKDKLGVCWPVKGVPHNSRPACTGAGAGTLCGDQCDGVDPKACHVPGAMASCGDNTCVAGIETHASTCSSGKCGDVPKSCGAYACGPTTCKTSCTTKADCAPGYVCKTNACVAADGLGTACTSAAACSTGFCTDNVCCGVADCGLGRSCATEKKGTCAKVLGVECTNDLECGSGHCADGVCCDSACTGQCEACDVPGRFGKCSPTTGAPHGLRARCDEGGGDPCKAKTCDGTVDTTTCAAYANGPTVECGSGTCEGSTYKASGTCDGKGACTTPEPRACAPYACDQAGCRTGCARDEHCADGFVCVTGTCKPLVAKCSEDRLSSIAKEGTTTNCAPYRCGPTGECITQCSSSSDCAPGAVCDPASKVCSTPATGGDEGGGCAMGQRTSPGIAAVLLVVGLVAAQRRRRQPRV